MRAITVIPGRPGQVQVTDLPDPPAEAGTLLVRGRLLGICGRDVDIVENGYGWPPPGEDRLVIGHESLGEVLEAPADSIFTTGDPVAGIVRRPDPVPCEPCGQGEWDFCRNGRYTERGIKELDGYGAQLWRIEPAYAIRLNRDLGDCGVLLEPASVRAKDQVNKKMVLENTVLFGARSTPGVGTTSRPLKPWPGPTCPGCKR